jgi:Ca-activated chloride channel family protein
MTLSVKSDRTLIRAQASSARYLLVRVDAPVAESRRERLPVNVALVLDRSGSMAGEGKFPLARQAVEQALRMLRPDDRFALVVYDGEIDVVARSTPATPEAKRHALAALDAIEPRGSTNLFGGWMRGCEQVADHLSDDRVSRVLLLTDGLANQGERDPGALAHHAAELRRRGIATSTFGVGDDFDERLLRDMAHEGGGNFWFISAPAQIPDLLTSELGEALEVTVRRAVLTVQLPRGATAEPLNRFRCTHAPGDRELRIELGDLSSGQEVVAVVKVQLPRGEVGDRAQVRVAVGPDDALAPLAESSLSWTYASHAENDRQPRDVEVDREVAKLYAARARAEATEANRDGDFTHARRVLERTAHRIREYAGHDAELGALASALVQEDVQMYALESMSAPMLKRSLFAAEMSAKGRAADGRARRRPTA